MSTQPSSSIPIALPGLLALAALAVAGCTQSEAATPLGPTTAAEAPAAPAAAGPKVDTDTYTIEMKTSGKYKAGQEGLVEVTLVPKNPYHINDKYPIKFKVADPAAEGIKYPKAILKREDGTVDLNKGLFKVPFIAAKAGKAKLSGMLYLSVCSDANCIMDKQELEASVDVE